MDDQAAGKVESPQLGQKTAAPDPVCHGIIDEDGPEEYKNTERTEADPFGKGPCNEGRRNDGKHALEGNEGQLRNGAAC